jgi:diguanylate cyclase (GGDEF)-like protein/PAS domain S-box-containing protein
MMRQDPGANVTLNLPHEYLAAIINALPAEIALLDAKGVILEVNQLWREFARSSGYTGGLYGIGSNYLSICDSAKGEGADEGSQVAAGIRRVLSGEASDFRLEYPCHTTARQRWFQMSATALRSESPPSAGGPVAPLTSGVVVMHIDITERKLAELQQQRAAQVFSAMNDAVIITDAAHFVSDVNPAFTRITGFSREEVIGTPTAFLATDNQSSRLHEEMWLQLSQHGCWRGESRNRRKNGEIYTAELTVSAVKDAAGKLINYVMVISDITHLKAYMAELDHVAHYDLLTGLPNRRLLDDRLLQAMRLARRTGAAVALCFLDLDNFKPINDELGHDAGDQALAEIARRLRAALRDADTVARIGGDEFVVLLPGVERRELPAVLQRIMNVLKDPIALRGANVKVSGSMGVVMYPDDDVDAVTLLQHADQAMYAAKEAGRSRYHLYEPVKGPGRKQSARLADPLVDDLDRL